MYNTSSTEDFKLKNFTDNSRLTRRNMKIWNMVLNRLDLPDHLHEFVTGVYLAGEWENHEWIDLQYIKIARHLTTTESIQIKVSNRLRKQAPALFLWQESTSTIIIERRAIPIASGMYKTKYEYKISSILYSIINSLFHLPVSLRLQEIKREVEKFMKDFPVIEREKKEKKKKSSKTALSYIRRGINELIESEGSREMAVIELGGHTDITEFFKEVLRDYNQIIPK